MSVPSSRLRGGLKPCLPVTKSGRKRNRKWGKKKLLSDYKERTRTSRDIICCPSGKKKKQAGIASSWVLKIVTAKPEEREKRRFTKGAVKKLKKRHSLQNKKKMWREGHQTSAENSARSEYWAGSRRNTRIVLESSQRPKRRDRRRARKKGTGGDCMVSRGWSSGSAGRKPERSRKKKKIKREKLEINNSKQ